MDQNMLPIGGPQIPTQQTPQQVVPEPAPAPAPEQVNEETLPLSVTSYSPIGDEGLTIAQISPAKFDSLLKILTILTSEKSSNNSIAINESKINQGFSGGSIFADITEIFGKPVSLQIINPKKYTKLFKQFKNNNDVFIIDDNDNSRYIVSNGEIKVFLPKQLEGEIVATGLPDFSQFEVVSQIKIDKSVRGIITGLSNDADYIEYLIQENSLKAIHIPDTAIYLFQEYTNDPKASKLDETNADIALRSTVFCPITAEEYTINICKSKTDASYVSFTTCNTGLIDVYIYENLEVMTGGNILI